MKKKTVRILLAAMLATSMVAGCIGCGKTEEPKEDAKTEITVNQEKTDETDDIKELLKYVPKADKVKIVENAKNLDMDKILMDAVDEKQKSQVKDIQCDMKDADLTKKGTYTVPVTLTLKEQADGKDAAKTEEKKETSKDKKETAKTESTKDEKAKKQSEAGRKAMEKRWKKDSGKREDDNLLISNLSENDNLLISKPSENDNKESKEKERKVYNTQKDKETNTCEEPEMSVEEKCHMTFKYFNDMTVYYNSAIKPVKVLTGERMRKLEEVVRRYDRNQIASAIRNAMNSDFLNGRTSRRKLPADFDWIFEERNFTKIFEGSI